MDRKPKTVFQLDSPFTATQWPQISSQTQETILELSCSLLSQIGQHRSNHITTSKGKRKKRKRHQEANSEDAPIVVIPPPPEISSFLVIGMNSIIRTLEFSSQKSRPQIRVLEISGDTTNPGGESQKVTKQDLSDVENHSLSQGHFSAIFVCRCLQSSVLYEHLPQLVYTASLAFPSQPPTKLVELPSGSEARLAKALGIPRVSSIGVLDGAPLSQSLVDLVRGVSDIEIPWLQQAKRSKYLPVKINAIGSFTTTVKKDKD
ncbi:hypothetical protein D0Z07_6584 [Hyphodiscus hymeniophilus]|uniref:Uncharacterized protein n=1 Tax=Hyphodiscus hymeniophilus TaxID=353542 RepID=A0A9P6VGY0_9HELO|nr:hypothetical protein D0Z07_6584 [Hyphodiscus hymeniophilus]